MPVTDLKVIALLEKATGKKIPQVQTLKWDTVGYVLNDEHKVQTLGLSSIDLSSLPSELVQLQSLTGLNLRANKLSSLPPEIVQLQRLTSLNLSSNELSSLPPELVQLQSLTRLSLSSNKLSSLAPEIGELRSLTSLDLSSNELSSLPPEIVQLQSLTRLDLGSNELSSLPPEIVQLQSLTSLYLRSNKLSSLPPEIGELQSLTRLSLSSNELSSLPPEIVQLQSLTILYLRSNKLSSLPPEIGELQGLTDLDLRSNRLSSLPPEIVQLGLEFHFLQTSFVESHGVHLYGNPLQTPPVEILDKGLEAVRQYFEASQGEKALLSEVKILLVGDGGAGKTSLVKRIRGEPFDPAEDQTDGINIDDYAFEVGNREIIGHFWDFGGQVIMHATHQFFLSKRSAYILVLDGRKDDNTEYWLKTIESFGGDSPVLVVLNKIDQNPGFSINRRHLQKKYPGIVGFYRVSCKGKDGGDGEGIGIDELREALHQALLEIEMLQTQWPKPWFDVKQKLETMDRPFINFDTYTKLCESTHIDTAEARNTLVQFLADLGVIVHFSDFELRDVYVLEPEWVTRGVYTILNSEQLAENKGILNLKLLQDILDLKTYSLDKHPYLVSLMEKFELCYKLQDRQHILVPDLLDEDEPEFDDDGDQVRFRIDYDFLPRSIMPRFIVKMHEQIHNDLRWRSGVVLHSRADDATAVVIADYQKRSISIQVKGRHRRDYFTAVLHTLRQIHKDFDTLEHEEKIQLPDEPKATVSYDYLLRLVALGDGATPFLPERAQQKYTPLELLGIVQSPQAIDGVLAMLEEIQKELSKPDPDKSILDMVSAKPGVFGFQVDLIEAYKQIRDRSKK